MYRNEHIIVLVIINGIGPLKMYDPDIYYFLVIIIKMKWLWHHSLYLE